MSVYSGIDSRRDLQAISFPFDSNDDLAEGAEFK